MNICLDGTRIFWGWSYFHKFIATFESLKPIHLYTNSLFIQSLSLFSLAYEYVDVCTFKIINKYLFLSDPIYL